MIVRTTNDPAAWRDLGPWQPDAFATDTGEVTTAYLEPDDLARIRARDAARPAPTQRPVRGILSETERMARQANRGKAGGEAVRRLAAERIPDLSVVTTLTATGGNITAAAERLGVSGSALWRRVDRLRRSGRLPDTLRTGRDTQYVARRPWGSLKGRTA